MSRVEGADEFIRDLRKLGDNMNKVERAMLKAGGEVMAESWRITIEWYDFLDSHSMHDHVISRVTGKSGTLRAEITSEGYDDHGTRNAFKAFILHYGTNNGRIPASHWIDTAEDAASAGVHAAMSAVLTQFKFDVVCLQDYFNYKESYGAADLTDWKNCRISSFGWLIPQRQSFVAYSSASSGVVVHFLRFSTSRT